MGCNSYSKQMSADLQEIEETRNRRHELLIDLLDLFCLAPNTVSSTVIFIDVTNLPSRDYSYTYKA